MTTTNLSNEQLEGKLNAAVEEYNTVDNNLRQAREQVESLEKALEQRRGRVILLDELIKEQQGIEVSDTPINGEVEQPEVVTGEVVNAATSG